MDNLKPSKDFPHLKHTSLHVLSSILPHVYWVTSALDRSSSAGQHADGRTDGRTDGRGERKAS